MVSPHDPWITPEERTRCSEIAIEIDAIASRLLDKRGQDVPNERHTAGSFSRDRGLFLRRYTEGSIAVEHTGPESIPTEWPFCLFVRMNGRLLTRQIDSTPASLECDLDVAEKALGKLKAIDGESA